MDFEGEIVRTTRLAEHTEIYLESASTINAGQVWERLGVFVPWMRLWLEQALHIQRERERS